MNTLASLWITLALPLASFLNVQVGCESVSADETRALFTINRFLESSIVNYKIWSVEKEMSAILDDLEGDNRESVTAITGLDGVCKELMEYLLRISDTDCSRESIDRLVLYESRLEMDENLDKKPKYSSYKTKPLSRYLEHKHLNLIDSCLKQSDIDIREWNESPAIVNTRKTFLGLAFRIGETMDGAKSKRPLMKLMGQLVQCNQESKPALEMRTLNEANSIVSDDSLFLSFKKVIRDYFVGENRDNRALCSQKIEENLIKPHSESEERMRKIENLFVPLNQLVLYKPKAFETMSKREMETREMSRLPPIRKGYSSRYKAYVALITLHEFVYATLRRANELCQ